MNDRKRRKDIINLIGKKFSRLEVLSLSDEVGINKEALWLCRCDCGMVKFVSGRCLRNGSIQSCGCLQKEIARNKAMPLGEASLNKIMDNYKRKAKNRNLKYSLSKDEFRYLTKQNCYYCGSVPKTSYKSQNSNGHYIYNGIDRLNNEKGYILDNCVSCCETCNRAKLQMTENEFLILIRKIYENRIKDIKELRENSVFVEVK